MARIPASDLAALLQQMQKHAELVRALVGENYAQTRALEGHFAEKTLLTAKSLHHNDVHNMRVDANRAHKDKLRCAGVCLKVSRSRALILTLGNPLTRPTSSDVRLDTVPMPRRIQESPVAD